MIELCSEYLSVRYIWLYVLAMPRMRFRVNPLYSARIYSASQNFGTHTPILLQLLYTVSWWVKTAPTQKQGSKHRFIISLLNKIFTLFNVFANTPANFNQFSLPWIRTIHIQFFLLYSLFLWLVLLLACLFICVVIMLLLFLFHLFFVSMCLHLCPYGLAFYAIIFAII